MATFSRFDNRYDEYGNRRTEESLNELENQFVHPLCFSR